MKTLALTLIISLSSFTFTFAQNNSTPINSISLEVEMEDGVSILNWESNKEVNTSYYLIEKSIDGKNFKTIATQKAGSSTYQTTNYTYEDVEDNAQVANYRIKLILMDGSSLSAMNHPMNNQEFASIVEK